MHTIHTLPSIKFSDLSKSMCIHKKEELSIVQEEERQSLIKSIPTKNSYVESSKLSNRSLSLSQKLSVSNSILDVSSESSSQDASQVFEWVSSRYTD